MCCSGREGEERERERVIVKTNGEKGREGVTGLWEEENDKCFFGKSAPGICSRVTADENSSRTFVDGRQVRALSYRDKTVVRIYDITHSGPRTI